MSRLVVRNTHSRSSDKASTRTNSGSSAGPPEKAPSSNTTKTAHKSPTGSSTTPAGPPKRTRKTVCSCVHPHTHDGQKQSPTGSSTYSPGNSKSHYQQSLPPPHTTFA